MVTLAWAGVRGAPLDADGISSALVHVEALDFQVEETHQLREVGRVDPAELAAILEAATGWLGGHLHAFESADGRFAMPDPEWPDHDLDERAFQLRDVLPGVGSKLRWDYEFGDGWEHDVVVEEIGPLRSDFDGLICLANGLRGPA